MRSLMLFYLMFVVLGVKGQTLNSLYKESLKAYEKKDYEKFKQLSNRALELNPSQPAILLNMAIGCTLTGENSQAEEILDRLITWNTQLKYRENKDLKSLLADNSVLEKLEETRTKYNTLLVKSKLVARFSDTMHLEDIEKIGSVFYFTDVHNGSVVAYDQNSGKTRILATLPLSAMAMAEGITNKTLWVSTAVLSQFKKKNTPKTRPVLYEIDIETGSLLDSIMLPGKAILGSMVKGEDNFIYASNSAKPEIYVVNTNLKKIQKIIPVHDAFNLQGIDINFTKNRLYVADYIKGVLIQDIEQENVRTWIITNSFLLKGFDGIQFIDRRNLLIIQNNSTPKRVIKIMHLDGRIQNIQLLDNKLPLKGEPTNGFFDPELGYYYIANSQWPFYDKENKPKYELWQPQQIRFISLEDLR
jgi:hypothetical protein